MIGAADDAREVYRVQSFSVVHAPKNNSTGFTDTLKKSK